MSLVTLIMTRYSFGLMMWEVFTGGRAFYDVPNTLLAQQIAYNLRRPVFPEGTPLDYLDLARKCWDQDPDSR